MTDTIEQKFLAQCRADAKNDYDNSVIDPRSDRWDWVIISASNDIQATFYQSQIERRKKDSSLPIHTKFAVVPDIEGLRIGSGGATLNILKYVKEHDSRSFNKLKILVLHSGGDSKRTPQYSVCGKLFAPIPCRLINNRISTIFDELLISFSVLPARLKPGMLTMSGDTIIFFNSAQVDADDFDALGISIKTNVAVGKEHGVFVDNNEREMTIFLHKESEETLREKGAVDFSDRVNVDTGCIWFSSSIINSLWSLISENDVFSETKFSKFVNSEVCLSFYADFVYPLSADVTFESYCAVTPENGIKKDLMDCRREIWNLLKHYKFGVVKLNPAKYMHFGTTEELFSLLTDNRESFTSLEWQAVIGCNRVFDKENEPTIINSFIDKSVAIPKESFVENSVIKGISTIGRNTILSGINADNCVIPDNVALHCVKLKNGKFVCRIYGITDNPKNSLDNKFLLSSVSSFYHEKNNHLSIWDAKLFCESDTPEAAVKAALILYNISANTASPTEIISWQKSVRHSFNSSFNAADTNDFERRRNEIEQNIGMNVFVESANNPSPLLSAIDNLFGIIDHKAEMPKLLQFARQSTFPLNMRLYHALSILAKRSKCNIGNYTSEQLEDFAYGTMKRMLCDDCFNRFGFYTEGYVQDSVDIKLPARINFCGSPTDAAPYCIEHGGTMLDGALLLNGDFPITVTVSRINDLHIVLQSIDQNDKITIDDIDSIRDCGNPSDRFALHKAVLLACGVVPLHGNSNLKDLLRKYGGGLRLSTHARIPKGSGLGTSSIIAAASVAAINKIFGIAEDNDRVYTQVFTAEQLMNTGGGWQDQVGAYTPGIKLMSSKPGIAQTIKVEQLDLTDEVKQELNERFALVFSGQRRLARNVLREELNRIIENDPTAMGALDKIRKICLIMKFELERGNVTGFAKLITEQFELVKTIDEGASNTYIEYIFESCADLIDGKSICGAGGGGFLQLILKKGVGFKQLKERMEQTFGDSGVKVWEGDLIL